jgi:hypothetical protein
MKKFSVITPGALLAICLVLLAGPAWALGIDPPVWAVTGTGVANQFSGQNFLFANEVNKLGAGTDIGLYVQGGSPSNTDFAPMYLILGIPNVSASFTLPTITSEKVYYDAGTPNGSGIINAGAPNVTASTVISASTLIGQVPGPGSTTVPLVWTGSPNSVYDALGLGGADASENFTNWVSYETHLSPAIVATQFLIAVYDVSSFTHTASFTGEGLIDVKFSAGLPIGTYVIGYGCQNADCINSNPNPFSTPFTQSGIITQGRTPPTQVPQPATLMVLGVSLVSFVVGSAFKRRIS